MPIEIREVVIRATVTEEEPRTGQPYGPDMEALRQEIIAECIDRVMEILRQRNER
jgi:hypothetical protein